MLKIHLYLTQYCGLHTHTQYYNGLKNESSIANYWARIYETEFKCNNAIDKTTLNATSQKIYTHKYPENYLTEYDVKRALKEIGNNKSAGPDKLKAEHIRYCPTGIITMITLFFNLCISHSFLPSAMLLVNIVPIYKRKGSSLSSKNYRPIALATVLSKLMEHCILDKFKVLLSCGDHQFGYKQKLGTELEIWAVKNVISHYRNNNSSVIGCFLDATKAFDTVLHGKLAEKLKKRNMPQPIINILIYWWQTQCFQVKWGNYFSYKFKTEMGVRQGGILRPYLFNIYMDDLGQKLRDLKIGCQIGKVMTNNFWYADDICLLAPSIRGAQKLIDVCYDYANSHNIKFNPTKTVCMLFETKRCTIRKSNIYMNQNVLTWVTQFNYLGYMFDSASKQQDKCEIEKRLRNMRIMGNVIATRFRHTSDSVKKILFSTYFSNLYCMPLWIMSAKMLKTAQVAHNDCFRALFKIRGAHSISELFQNYELPNFKSILKSSVNSLITRLKSNDNDIVSAIVNCNSYYESDIYKSWTNIVSS